MTPAEADQRIILSRQTLRKYMQMVGSGRPPVTDVLAGVLGGGNRRDRVMVIRIRDGRSAMIKGNSKDAEALMAASFGNRPSEMKTIEAAAQGRIEPTP